MTSFESFGLAEPIARALAEEHYLTPTPIQAQTVPLALKGRDIIGIAQTGTGKTAAFALPILQLLSASRVAPERKTCRVLVLSPTRELSSQILDSFRAYGRHLGISTALAIGGVPMGAQVRALLNGVDVLVATPGRLIDLVHSNALRLSRVEFLVLDEADRMLDMGFVHDIRRIVAKLPARRQTLLFSATMPQAIAELAGAMLRDPARVAVAPVASTVESVTQRIVHVERQGKVAVLADLLRSEPVERALIFTRTKHGADKLVRSLATGGIGAEAIHGNKSQNQRERVLAAFKQGKVHILVATDIAARGIDVDGISHVVNYDLPNEPEVYVHRIGRTARAGNPGTAISLCDGEEMPYLRAIEKLIRLSLPATDRRSHPVQSGRTAAPGNGRQEAQRAQSPRKARGERRDSARSRPTRQDARPAGREGREPQGRDRNGDKRNGRQRPLAREHIPADEREGHGLGRRLRAAPPRSLGAAANDVANSAIAAPSIVEVEDLSRVAFLHRAINPRHSPQQCPVPDRLE